MGAQQQATQNQLEDMQQQLDKMLGLGAEPGSQDGVDGQVQLDLVKNACGCYYEQFHDCMASKASPGPGSCLAFYKLFFKCAETTLENPEAAVKAASTPRPSRPAASRRLETSKQPASTGVNGDADKQ